MQLKGESGGSPGELITVSAMSIDNQCISFPDSSIPVPSQLLGVLRVGSPKQVAFTASSSYGRNSL